MGRRGSELQPQLRGRILELRDLGWSLRKIAVKHEISYSTVRSTVEAAKKRATTQASLPQCGAPRVISEEQRDAIYDTIQTNLNTTYEDLQSIASNASQRTIRQLLRDMNIRMWQRKKRPALTLEHAQQRLAWAKEYQHFTYLN